MKRKRHEVGDIVVLSGAFWGNFGTITKVTEINGKIITAQDDKGRQFAGADGDFFTVEEAKELAEIHPKWNDVNFNHPWLNTSTDFEPSYCNEFKESDFKFCPRCGDEL